MATSLTRRGLAGLDYLACATDLLMRTRSEDLSAGLWEAADLHWWWRDEGWDDPEGQLFWFDPSTSR